MKRWLSTMKNNDKKEATNTTKMWQLGRGDDDQHKMTIKRKQGSITKEDDQEEPIITNRRGWVKRGNNH
jgi:hypothetical protein